MNKDAEMKPYKLCGKDEKLDAIFKELDQKDEQNEED